MRSHDDLRQDLRRIDGRGYPAYKDLLGSYALGDFELHVDRVQGDPFAAPSLVRLRAPRPRASLPEALLETRVRRIALEDHLARRFASAIDARGRSGRGSGKSGLVRIDAGGQAVLERTAVRVDAALVEARLAVGLPAAGRRILGREAEELLCERLPDLGAAALLAETWDEQAAFAFVRAVEIHSELQAALAERGLVAFISNDAILPRSSGRSEAPLRDAALAFEAPGSLSTTLEVPAGCGPAVSITGLGIPEGVTVVVGGGYHGKSTVLQALARGVHPHLPGDGRERVATRFDAVKIRAEEGRRVECCDISGFIQGLPGGRSTEAFRTEDASGSTSQAANIAEALEAGSRLLLLDEDTSATNFMVRDARMQALVPADREPITPFVDRVRALYEEHGVSTVLVMGGSGDYLDVADTVIEMRAFEPHDATDRAREVARRLPTRRSAEATGPVRAFTPRVPDPASLDPGKGRRAVRIDVRERGTLGFGTETIDLCAVEQLVDPSQTRAIGLALVRLRERHLGAGTSLSEALDALETELAAEGLECLDPGGRRPRHPGDLARPRRYEIAAALARLRTIRMEPMTADTSG